MSRRTTARRSLPPRADGGCPTGYHARRAYTVRRTGTRVAAACVRATTPGEPRAAFLKRTRQRMTQRLKGFPKDARGPAAANCPRGTIRRDPYVRIRMGRRSYVAGACIADQGAPGKGLPSGARGIGALRKGDLRQFGYTNVTELSEGRRHLALAAAVRAYGSLTIWRKLNAVYVYTRRTSPASSAIFKADRDWIAAYYGIKAF